MEAARAPTGPIALSGGRGSSTHLLRLVSDEGLVKRVRAGNERAFNVIYERYQRPMLAFSRHMLGSQQEAEDAVQQTFANAFRDLQRSDRDIKLRPWLYRIARNQCITSLRHRRPTTELPDSQPSLVGLSDEVAARGELRALLADLALLPFQQREALVLAELHDNSHTDVAAILGCEVEKVKSLVFQARSSLIASREARDLSCEEVRKSLSTLRGPSLRRGAIGRHVKQCDGCRAFGDDVRRQRQQLATLLVMVPSAGLKFGAANAIAAAGAKASGTATAGTATAFSAGAGAGVVGTGAAATGKLLLPAVLVKAVATVTAASVLAVGGAVGVERVRDVVAPKQPAAGAADAAREGEVPGGGAGGRASAAVPGAPRRADGPLRSRGRGLAPGKRRGRLRQGGSLRGTLPPAVGGLPGAHGQRNRLEDRNRGRHGERRRGRGPVRRAPERRPVKREPLPDTSPGTTEPDQPPADQPDSPPATP
jgi:RNA polymerase sigma factor (sigma-70 family)